LDFSVLLNCNNLKKLQASNEDIINSLKLSTVVEMNKDNLAVRRVGNRKLPELKLLQIKRSSPTNETKKEEEKEEFDNVILAITALTKSEMKWKAINEEFKKQNKNLNVIYIRFQEGKGNIGIQVNKKHVNSLTFSDKLKVENVEFKIEKCIGDDLITFWKDHGEHFKMCTTENDRKNGKKKQKEE